MIMRSTMNPNDQPIPEEEGVDFGPTDVTPPRASTVMLGSFLPGLLDDVLTGQPPPEYQFTNEPWGTLALRPREIMCIGGPPNTGKTALMLQIVTGALLLNTDLRAVFACVEMGERILMERVLSRLSGVYLGKILKRERDEFFAERIEAARAQLESLSNRLMFVRAPFTMMDVWAACDKFGPQIVALDYLQRIPADLSILETRQQVTHTMSAVRAPAVQQPVAVEGRGHRRKRERPGGVPGQLRHRVFGRRRVRARKGLRQCGHPAWRGVPAQEARPAAFEEPQQPDDACAAALRRAGSELLPAPMG